MSIYGFISDESFHSGTSRLISTTEANNNVGYLSDKILSYFISPTKIYDARSSRLSVLISKAKGLMSINLDGSTITEDDLNTATDEEFNCLLNIAELIYLSYDETEESINQLLLEDEVLFAGYVDESVNVSSATAYANIKLNNDTTITAAAIRTWISFDMVIGQNGATKNFKLWLSNIDFEASYPISNIMSVIPPCDPDMLITLDYDNVPEAIVDSSNYVNEQLSDNVGDTDNTGLLTFHVRYINSSFGAYYNMPFTILYKGAEPSSIQIKIAIRDYLISVNDDEEIWQNLFPSLYTSSMFYIIPMWSNITILANRELYPSIINYPIILTKTKETLTALSSNFIENHIELINSSVTELLMAVVPNSSNDNNTTLLNEHPTYQAIDAQSLTFEYQETHTREFNVKLSNCLAILDGGTNEDEFVTTVINNRNWLSFTVNLIEYHVLYKEDFPA